jgi:hypothetical protein
MQYNTCCRVDWQPGLLRAKILLCVQNDIKHVMSNAERHLHAEWAAWIIQGQGGGGAAIGLATRLVTRQDSSLRSE